MTLLQLLKSVFGVKTLSKYIGLDKKVVKGFLGKNNPFVNDWSPRHLQNNPEMLEQAKATLEKGIAHALSNPNAKQTLQFKSNLKKVYDIENRPKASVTEIGTKKKVEGEGLEVLTEVQGTKAPPDTFQGGMESLLKMVDDYVDSIRGVPPKRRLDIKRQERSDFIRRMRNKGFDADQIKYALNIADKYSMNMARMKTAPAIKQTKEFGGGTRSQIEMMEEYLDDLKSFSPNEFQESIQDVSQLNYKIRESILADLRAKKVSEQVLEEIDSRLGDLAYRPSTRWTERSANHPANWLDKAAEDLKIFHEVDVDVKFYKNFADDLLSKYKTEPEFNTGGIVGPLHLYAGGKVWPGGRERFLKEEIDDDFWINHYSTVLNIHLDKLESKKEGGRELTKDEEGYARKQSKELKEHGGEATEFDSRIDDLFIRGIDIAAGGRVGYKKGTPVTFLIKKGVNLVAEHGPAFKKFVDGLFIKASNAIRQGKGIFKNLTQEQKITQHDNLVKTINTFEKKGTLEGTEQYFGINAEKAFIAAQAKVKKPKVKNEYYSKKEMEEEWAFENKLAKQKLKQEDQMVDTALAGMAERQLLKIKYPGISDDLLNKILIDDNPQRKAEVLATMDQYLKLRELNKSESDAYNIITESFKRKKQASGGLIDILKL